VWLNGRFISSTLTIYDYKEQAREAAKKEAVAHFKANQK
jgi:hypothetical protein